ncbi:hypothetical protein OG210_21980 [Streptomyces sp. NBC_00466]|uniref:hypothetical protein n=1 Tax=Streptomyces sp. NBC_00466 TaxID=2903655 RepID=UPI0030E411CA
MNAAHLVEIATRSVGRSEVLMELALAWTVTTRPYISGTRGLARWTGTTDKVVRETAGPTGGHSEFKFLWTRTRGASSPTAEEREQMEIRLHSNKRTQNRSTPPKYFQAPEAPVGPQGDLALEEGLKELLEGNAVLSARISERAQEVLVDGMKTLSRLSKLDRTNERGQVLTALDPGLDLWAEIDDDNAVKIAAIPLGRRAWHLAVLCGLEDVVLSVADIETLTGLSKRGAQALLARMGKANALLVDKVRQGRSIAYEIRWASNYRMDGDWYEDASLRDEIRKARAAKDRAIQETSARRGTPAGYLAFLHSVANSRREQYLAEHALPENASREYRALVAEGDEMALYAYFKGQEDAVSIPVSPEALSAPLPAPKVERVPEAPRFATSRLSDEEPTPELLAAMRARMIRTSLTT